MAALTSYWSPCAPSAHRMLMSASACDAASSKRKVTWNKSGDDYLPRFPLSWHECDSEHVSKHLISASKCQQIVYDRIIERLHHRRSLASPTTKSTIQNSHQLTVVHANASTVISQRAAVIPYLWQVSLVGLLSP